jgi:hypothetical protein
MTWELTPELENDILTNLENGVGLRKWCEVEGRPSRSTILRWQRENADFEAKCAHAREAAGELAAEEHYEVTMDCLAGVVSPDVAGRVLSAMQWRAAKLASKKFGESTQVKHADADGNKLDIVSLVQALDGTSTGLPKIGG